MNVKENNTGSDDTIIENNYIYDVSEKHNNGHKLVNAFKVIVDFIKKIFKKK